MEIIHSKLRRQSLRNDPATGQRKKALLIGIKYDTSGSPESEDFGKLRGPHDDVQSVHDLLTDVYGYRLEDIVVLIDREGGDRRMQPTKVNITREIQQLVRNARPGDRLVFLFAGHSTQLTCSEHTEEDDMDEAIVPMDHSGPEKTKKSKLIMDNWLRKYLIDPLKPGVQLIAILDACHSGTLLDLDHNECNRVVFPWVNLGLRDHDTLRERVVRRDDTMVHSGSVVRFVNQQNRRTASLDAILARLSPQGPLSSRSPSLKFFRSNTATSVEMARGRLAKPFRAMKGVSWKNALRIDALCIKIPRCMSPETMSRWKCNGQCEVKEKPDVPYVISFASCRDEQLTWESSNAGSMTQTMVASLRREPRPRLRKLVESVAHSRHDASLRLHAAERRRRRRARRDPEDERLQVLLENVEFQTVQISSQQRLDMNAVFEF
ncbi:hypothetical protein DAEQUDRAFT_276836 [Daedalea quercina L-15889]|uniref:Peptidase C14 caspase domain-containing protein n=1 Tax=Daedalea quercina L-15889 TaxID=1314783 RepID=A0A165Q7P7_9APHY|nr:hypothetical protein DAEQUDRAFT_276836 [Daedalea quercina L-15889]